jgi:predicted transcriptional regulator
MAWRGTTVSGEHARESILAHIDRNPGISKGELSRATGLSLGSIRHHLFIMRRQRAIQYHRDGRRTGVYPMALSPEQMFWVGALREPITKGIMEHLEQNPDLGIQDLSHHLGLNRKTVRRYLITLEDAGIVSATDHFRPKFRMSRLRGVDDPEDSLGAEAGLGRQDGAPAEPGAPDP